MNIIQDIVQQQGITCCRVFQAKDVVLHSECCYTFHSPYTTLQGIVVNLQTGIGTFPNMAFTGVRSSSTDNHDRGLFVRIVKERRLKPSVLAAAASSATENTSESTTDTKQQPQEMPTKLALGVPGGFATEDDKYETIETHSIVVLEKSAKDADVAVQVVAEVPYTNETKATFPEILTASVESILHHAGWTTQQDAAVWQNDDEPIPVSKYAATLPVLDNGVVISPNPADWKCQKSGATENVWLNLSTGYMGGGRQHWDGSGGSNGAVEHYEATGKLYPLVVKLGTLSADLSTADCYSYAADEDGPVRIPNLAELLAKRGIHIANLQKTEKSTAELEVELNATYAFDAITEAGSMLQPLSGPGLQGLQNLGNSCYMNSVLQWLLSGNVVTELAQRYGAATTGTTTSPDTITQHALLQTVPPTDAPTHVLCQTVKVAAALTSGAFAKPLASSTDDDKKEDNDPKYRLAPRMFKHVIGKDHVDFRTGQQQDAAQFLQYFLERLDRAEIAAATSSQLQLQRAHLLKKSIDKNGNGNDDETMLYPSSHLFRFATMNRWVCTADQKIKYKLSSSSSSGTDAGETIWSLRIPMDKATTTASSVNGDKEKNDASFETSPEQKRLKPDQEESSSSGAAVPDNKNDPDSSGNDNNNNNNNSKNTKEKEPAAPVPTISFETCVQEWAANHRVEGVRWPHLHNETHVAQEQTRFVNFPRYLLVQLQRYTLGPDWSPVKLEVHVDVPESIDLTELKSTGPQDGEDLVPDDDSAETTAAAAAPKSGRAVLDEAALSQLMDMGFSLNSCKRALTAVGGSDVEAAMGWVFEHNMDPDFNDPLDEEDGTTGNNDSTNAAASGGTDGGGVDEAMVDSLVMNLGCFTPDQVRAALQICNGAADRAADWLFSHMDDLDSAIAVATAATSGSSSQAQGGNAESAPSSKSHPPLEDSESGKYTLMGIISHIGKSTGSGHYVAHLKQRLPKQQLQEGETPQYQWVIFNDEKVAVSSQPPIPHAYLYLFQRTDTIGAPPHPHY